MLRGGNVNENAIRASIRVSIFDGSATLVYKGHRQYGGSIVIPQAPKEQQEDMNAAMATALAILSSVSTRVVDLARHINILAVNPLAAPLAHNVWAIYSLFAAHPEAVDDKVWTLMHNLRTADNADDLWHALEVVVYTYESQYSATYLDGNDGMHTQARNNLHHVMSSLLTEYDEGKALDARALPLLAKISVTLLDPVTELPVLLHNLQKVAADAEAPAISFVRQFNFAERLGYTKETKAVQLLDNGVYQFLKQRCKDEMGRAQLISRGHTRKSHSKFLYLGNDGWQVARSSVVREAIYVSHALVEKLASNPLALAQVLAEEVGGHMDTSHFVHVSEEEAIGRNLRSRTVESYGADGGSTRVSMRIEDLLEPEVVMSPG